MTLVTTLGCDLDSKSVGDTTSGESACIAANLPEDGHGWESDDTGCAQPPEGPPVECPDPLDTLEQDCAEAGTPCDHETLITRDAALCIATEHGLDAGIQPWRGTLLYNYGVDAPAWVITSTSLSEECRSRGHELLIDAATGEVLMEGEWLAIC